MEVEKLKQIETQRLENPTISSQEFSFQNKKVELIDQTILQLQAKLTVRKISLFTFLASTGHLKRLTVTIPSDQPLQLSLESTQRNNQGNAGPARIKRAHSLRIQKGDDNRY